ncbi:GNAT family N-acetyltransferase [Sphingomonas sp. HDW15A]|uniref:GNAT family N-acetyltransferase n=1 Tax=Sphingomonas sp. HDW15A TaxID=2714942 RepID=UPI001F0E2C2E|nr:GNAT family N-acetyltransferase [Sphingomonas sp. HDW15A]
MQSSFHLAAGGPADLPDVMRIMSSAFPPTFGEGWSKSQCAGILPLGGVRLVVARTADGEPAGFSLDRRVVDEAELLLLAVGSGFQRQGLGTLLLREFIETHRGGDVARLHLEVRDGNPAVTIYEQFGFRAVGRRKDYYRGADGVFNDAVTMIRELE